MKRLMGISVVLLVCVACQQAKPERGWITAPRTGSPFVNFSFLDDTGETNWIHRQLGDFTVLALTRYDRDTHGPAQAVLRQIVAEYAVGHDISVVGIDVHWSESGAKHPPKCHLVDGEHHLLSICDTTGSVKRLYGNGDEDRLIVIGPDRTVVLSEPLSRATVLRAALDELVQRLATDRTFDVMDN